MTKPLENIRIAALVANGFEQVELTGPREALQAAGAQVTLISPEQEKVKAWESKHWGYEFLVDVPLDKANPTNYDALLLPGGVINPDTLRITPGAIEFIKAFVKAHKPIAAICHGPWTLINANAVRGRTVTSWPSLEIDLKNAGAHWVDKEVVIDGNLITSRKPDDVPAFSRAIIDLLSQ